jgi:hypothetical protein
MTCSVRLSRDRYALHTQHPWSLAVADPKIQTNNRTLDRLAHSLVNRLSHLNGTDQRIPANHVVRGKWGRRSRFEGPHCRSRQIFTDVQFWEHLLDHVHGPEIRDNSELGS